MLSLRKATVSLVCSLGLMAVTGVGFADSMMPGKGVTVRPIEGTNLEEKFQHQINL